MPSIIIYRVSPYPATGEASKVAEFTVELSDRPQVGKSVKVQFVSSDPTEGKLQNPSLTFSSDNWSQPQSLFIEGVDDDEDDGTIAYAVTGTLMTDDPAYQKVAVPVLTLTNLDDGLDRPLYLKGTENVDFLTGKNGNDRIYGGNDQDDLRGGRGDDRIYGQSDDDRLYGEVGDDKLYGGEDDDLLDGGEGDDSLFGETGRDTLLGGSGDDALNGGIEADSMVGGEGNDSLWAESGDTLRGGVGNDVLDGWLGGLNLMFGDEGMDSLFGGNGSDTLDGGTGSDSVVAGAGNDWVTGGAGNDTVIGGAGSDVANFSASAADLNISLSLGRAFGDGSDWLQEVENIQSGKGSDTLAGSAVANRLVGGFGRDVLSGAGGNDTLTGCSVGANGGRGEVDSLAGGAGADVFELGWSGGCYYNDGNASSVGATDYAVITDFEVGTDRLVLDGAASNYYVGASVSGVKGYGIYLEQGKTDELVAVIQSSTGVTVANTIGVARFV